MSTSVRREWSATIGAPLSGFALVIPYGYGLGGALLVGSAVRTPDVTEFATGLWVAGDLAAVIGAAACIDRFARSARDLRLPDHRAILRRTYLLLCTFLVLVPLILFRILVPDGRQLVLATLIVPLALSWPWLLRIVRPRRPSRSGVPTRRRRHPIHAPSDVIRVYLGRAFAPVPLASRVSGWSLLGAAAWSVPLMLTETAVAQSVRWLVPWYLGFTAVVVWAWLMTCLSRFISGRTAAFADLALLPGLGNAASQRRAFYGAALARPLIVCALFSVLAMGWAWSTSHAWRHVAMLGGVLAFLTLLSGFSILAQLLVPRTGRAPTFILVYQPAYIGPFLLINFVGLAERLPVAFFSSLLLLAAVLLAITGRQLRRQAELPHPFLQ